MTAQVVRNLADIELLERMPYAQVIPAHTA